MVYNGVLVYWCIIKLLKIIIARKIGDQNSSTRHMGEIHLLIPLKISTFENKLKNKITLLMPKSHRSTSKIWMNSSRLCDGVKQSKS